jgi:SAM-dependent methyltransferase
VRLDDPAVVAAEYACEDRLATRAAAYRFAEGLDPHAILFEAISEVAPGRLLEVGCGRGELSERIARELRADVVAVDQSARMVELTAARGLDARLGDVQQLELPDAAFDCAIAAWMLYHVPELDRALGELARVLRPGGRLVAVTNGGDHWAELYDLLGLDTTPFSFAAGEAGPLLESHFARVERRDAGGWIVFPDRAAAQEFVDASIRLAEADRPLPEFDGPLRVRRSAVVFVADKA